MRQLKTYAQIALQTTSRCRGTIHTLIQLFFVKITDFSKIIRVAIVEKSKKILITLFPTI